MANVVEYKADFQQKETIVHPTLHRVFSVLDRFKKHILRVASGNPLSQNPPDIHAYHAKYRHTPGPEISYLGHRPVYGPINMIDHHIDLDMPEKQTRSHKTEFNEQIYWDIVAGWKFANVSSSLSVEEQLIVNRIFSPLMPMVHIVRMKNDVGTKYVSTDVYDDDIYPLINYSDTKHASMAQSIYEYIMEDYDRDLSHNRNEETGSIYDFDFAGSSKRGSASLTAHLFISEFSNIEKQEYADMIIFWKIYIPYVIQNLPRSEYGAHMKIYQKMQKRASKISASRIFSEDRSFKENKLVRPNCKEIDNMIHILEVNSSK